LAGNAITEIALATLAPVLIAPAMHGKLWLHAAVQQNVATLRARCVEFIGPEDEGMLACGYEGAGRLWQAGGDGRAGRRRVLQGHGLATEAQFDVAAWESASSAGLNWRMKSRLSSRWTGQAESW
jgi:hypothetical protein